MLLTCSLSDVSVWLVAEYRTRVLTDIHFRPLQRHQLCCAIQDNGRQQLGRAR